MNREEKIRFLQSFSEKDLTQRILIPLFESMGFKGVEYTHGSLERGKDIVYYEKNKFGKKVYTAVVIKKVNINKKRAREQIVPQIREAFKTPFQDISNNMQREIHHVLLVTSGEINEYAKDFIITNLENEFMGKFISCLQCSDIISLLEEHMPETFWREYDCVRKYFLKMKEKFELIHDIVPIGLRGSISFGRAYVPLFLTENASRIERGLSLFMEPTHEDVFEKDVRTVYGVLEIMNRFDRVLIVGNPGSGKTTLLRFACLHFCRENIDSAECRITPIIFTLSGLCHSNQTLRDYIDTVLERYDFPDAKEYIEKDLTLGQCIVLMDGFDELVTVERKEWIRDVVDSFMKKYPKNRFVITSRIEGYHGEFPEFHQAEILEFEDDQIATFIEKWFFDTVRTDEILEKILSNSHIHALAKNPLMTAMIAMIYEYDEKIPQRRVELYDRCVKLLLSRWNRIRGIKNTFPADKKEFVLRKVALNFQNNRRSEASRTEILDEIAEHLPRLGVDVSQKDVFFEELCSLNGILRRTSFESYGFLHLSLQEYLAALEIEKTSNYDLIVEYISDSWWEETIRLIAGINGEGSGLIKKIIGHSQDGSNEGLFLAGKCLADATGTDLEVRNTVIQQLEEIFSTPSQLFSLDEALRVLVEIGSSEIHAYFQDCLSHADSLVRDASIDALILLHENEALPQLKEIARNDPEWRIRCHSIEALVHIGKKGVIPEIVRILSNDPEPRVRECSIKALEALEADNAIPFLEESLFNDIDIGVRSAAAKTLCSIGKKRVVTTLSRAYEKEENPIVKGVLFDILESWENPPLHG